MTSYDENPTTTALTWFLAILTTCLIIAGITIGGWAAGWWFTGQNTNREAHMIRNGYSNQQTLREQVTAQISNIFTLNTEIIMSDKSQTAALTAQRLAVAGILCQQASEITGDPLPANQQHFLAANCADGVVKPGAKFNP
jgi:hypothetical protein